MTCSFCNASSITGLICSMALQAQCFVIAALSRTLLPHQQCHADTILFADAPGPIRGPPVSPVLQDKCRAVHHTRYLHVNLDPLYAAFD